MNPAALKQAVRNEPVTLLVGIEFHVREGGLAAGFAKMITNLVLQDANQPALLCAAPGKALPTLERSKKCFLHHVLSSRCVSQTEERKLEQIIAILFDPALRIGETRRGNRRRSCSGFNRLWFHRQCALTSNSDPAG